MHPQQYGEPAQKITTKFGALAQLVARYIRIVEVSGSNPLCSTTRKTLDSIRILGSFFLYRKDRSWRSGKLKTACREAGIDSTISNHFKVLFRDVSD